MAWPLALVGLSALLIRLIYLHQLRDMALFSVLVGDSLEYDAWARRIAAGDWIGSEVFYQSPLYPYLLAAFYSVAGHHLFAVRVLQATLGAASCVLLAIAGKRFFDARTGLIAGAMLAVYPPAIFFDGLIQKSALDLFLITALIFALGGCLERPRGWWIAAAGVALGALALNRENARVLYPILAAWLVFSHRTDPLKQRLVRAAILTLAAAVVLVPVAARNAWVGGELLISTSQSGPNFYIGNRLGAMGGYEPLVPDRGNARFERQDATRLAEAASGTTLTAGEVSGYWWRRALEEIRQAPGAWMRLVARKIWLTLSAIEPVDTESLEAYAGYSPVLRALRWFTFGAVMGLAVFGAWVTRAEWRRLWVLYASFAALAVSVVMFYVFARYRFPLVPIAMLFGAAGVARAPRLRHGGSGLWLAVSVCAGLAVVLHVPVRTSSDQTYFNYGSVLLKSGRVVDAVPLLRDAVRADPSHLDARLSLASALQQTQEAKSAIEEFRAAVKLQPESAEAHAGLAIALHQHGQIGEAIAFYREAIRLRPAYVEAISNLALALQEVGSSDEAVGLFERAVEIQPQSVPLRMNLGRLLLSMGRGTDAIENLRQAAASASRPEDVVQTEYALAEALAREGRAAEAVSHMERARTAARAAGDQAALDSIERALRVLRGGR